MKKVSSFALAFILAAILVFPMNAFSMQTVMEWMTLANARPHTTINHAAAKTCPASQAKQIIYSGDARAAGVSVALGATWSAGFQMVEIMLGQLNANRVKVEMYCEQII